MYGAPSAGIRDPAQRAARDPQRPPEIQDGASNGYYNRAALDGSRPAIYFINLKDICDWPKYTLPTLTYHEGVPGHHLQISLAQESNDIPTLRKLGFFPPMPKAGRSTPSSSPTSWALCHDPLGRAGFLQSFLFRAARLVVDTGIHAKRWSREQATDYMVATTGYRPAALAARGRALLHEPGQACSYKIGHTAWTRARAEAQRTLGRPVRRQALPRDAQRRRDAADASSSGGSGTARQRWRAGLLGLVQPERAARGQDPNARKAGGAANISGMFARVGRAKPRGISDGRCARPPRCGIAARSTSPLLARRSKIGRIRSISPDVPISTQSTNGPLTPFAGAATHLLEYFDHRILDFLGGSAP